MSKARLSHKQHNKKCENGCSSGVCCDVIFLACLQPGVVARDGQRVGSGGHGRVLAVRRLEKVHTFLERVYFRSEADGRTRQLAPRYRCSDPAAAPPAPSSLNRTQNHPPRRYPRTPLVHSPHSNRRSPSPKSNIYFISSFVRSAPLALNGAVSIFDLCCDLWLCFANAIVARHPIVKELAQYNPDWHGNFSTLFLIISHANLSSMPPLTRHVIHSTWWSCSTVLPMLVRC